MIDLFINVDLFLILLLNEANRGAEAQIVTAKSTGCVFDPNTRKSIIYLYLYFHFFALVSRQSPDFGRKWRMECLNTKFPSGFCLGARVEK